MRAFCAKVLLFLAPVVVLSGLLEGALRRIPNDYSFKRAYLDRHAQDIEVLILGSSHSYYDIDPAYLKARAFNAAHVSQSIKYDDYILDKYWDRLERLRVVVWPISYFSLFWELEEGLESWRVKDYAIYYDCPYHWYSVRRRLEILNGTMTSHLRRLARFYGGRRSDVRCSETGCIVPSVQPQQQDLGQTGAEAVARHRPADYANVQRILQRLETRVRLCRQKGIAVVFITTPTWITYRGGVSAADWALIESSVGSLCEKYDNASYVNFLADARFGEDDFRNADHLNAQGTQKFSRILNDLIEERLRALDHTDDFRVNRVSALRGPVN